MVSGTKTAAPTVTPERGATVVMNVPAVTSGPKPTVAPTQPVLVLTRDQAIPKNTTVDIGSDMRVTILLVTRPANDIVAQGNMFNDAPVPNQEYLMVKMHVECAKSSNEKCSFNDFEFKTVGADGQVHDRASVAGIPQAFEPFAEFFGGAALDGNIVFLVTQGDSKVVLVRDPVYIALQ